MKTKNILPALLVLFAVTAQQASAQFNPINTSKLQIYASVTENTLAQLKKAEVTLYEDVERNCNWQGVERMKTNAMGEFSFKLDYNSKYLVEISKPGYTTKSITFDTNVFGSTITSQDFYFAVDMALSADGKEYQQPVANVFYIVEKKKFDYELNYAKAEAGK